MTLNMKVGGAWKEAQSLHVKINGEWKDVETLYSKKDGAWVTVYSAGALITFNAYPYPIPVAKGWKYSTDKVNWTEVTSDSTINTSGTFTGYVKAKGTLTLSDYYTTYTAPSSGRKTGTSLSETKSNSTSFVNNSKGYVCGGAYNDYGYSSGVVNVYDSSGNRTTGKPLATKSRNLTSFTNNSKGYVCGGRAYVSGSDDKYIHSVTVYDSSGNRTTGTSLSVSRAYLTSFVNNSKGYVCGGITGSSSNPSYQSTVDVYYSPGNRTTGTSLSIARSDLTSFVVGSRGYVCGGVVGNTTKDAVDIYDSSGTRTTGTSLSIARSNLTSFVVGSRGYVCGGTNNGQVYVKSTVDIYDSSGNRTTGTDLSVARSNLTSFVVGSRGYVCGGYAYISSTSTAKYYSNVDMYDSSGNRSTGKALSVKRSELTSFANGNNAYVCGGATSITTPNSTVDIYYDIPESCSTKIPITAGSTYTLNGESGTADVSKVMEFDSKVSGTIKYKAGDMSPSVRITVVDESGNVVSGADITIERA